MTNDSQGIERTRDEGSKKITVMNPVGYPPKITPKPMAPRLDSLDGKTVYLVDPRFDDSGLFLHQVQELVCRAHAFRHDEVRRDVECLHQR